jgi:hypothetical protein
MRYSQTKVSNKTVPTTMEKDHEEYLHLAVGNRQAFDHTRLMATRRLWKIQGVKKTKPQPKDLFQLHRKSIVKM